MGMLCFDRDADKLCYKTLTPFILFQTYEDKGWKKSDWIQVPDSSFAFNIISNFGYGNKSYLRCSMKYKDQLLINSENWCKTGKELTYWEEQPTPDYWGHLLQHITDTYKKRHAWNYNNMLEAAKELNHYLSFPETLEVRTNKWSKTPFNYSPQRKNIHLIVKCEELITLSQELKLYEYDNFKQIISAICNKIIALIFETYNYFACDSTNSTTKYSDLEKITNSFDTVYTFMRDTNQLHLLFCNNTLK